MTVTPDLLRSVPLFAAMSDHSIELVAGLFQEVAYADGATLVRQGDPGEEFIVLLEGRARVEQEGHLLRELGAGDFLGEISLLDGRPRTATVVATYPVRAMIARRTDFMRLIDEHRAIRYSVLTALTERVRHAAPSPGD
jgi:CRP-like cAMP-binding protein